MKRSLAALMKHWNRRHYLIELVGIDFSGEKFMKRDFVALKKQKRKTSQGIRGFQILLLLILHHLSASMRFFTRHIDGLPFGKNTPV